MCLSLPAKIISIKNDRRLKKRIIIESAGQKKEASGSLIRVKAGDYVFLKNNFIIGKINKKEAKEIKSLIENKV